MRQPSAYTTLKFGTIGTFEIGRENRLKIGRLHGGKCPGAKEDLLQRVARLPEMEQEEFHQSGFGVRTEYLLQTVDAQRSLIL